MGGTTPAITDQDGKVAYLKTYRLSKAQTRRGHLLTQLAGCDWNLEATAAHLGIDVTNLVQRMERAGFAELLRQDIRDHYRANARRRH